MPISCSFDAYGREHIAVYESQWSSHLRSTREYHDMFGNICWRRGAARADHVRYTPSSRSGDRGPVVPDAPPMRSRIFRYAIVFTLPSRTGSDQLLDDAGGCSEHAADVGAHPSGCDGCIQHHLRNGSSTPSTTALDIYKQRAGVCRDFALLAVAFCRALNIPARYTFGYLPDIAIEAPDVPMDFHTWFEAYVGGRWYTFDARHNTPRIGRVVIGRGRDAVDCALSTAFGAAELAKFVVWSDEITAERRAVRDGRGRGPPGAPADRPLRTGPRRTSHLRVRQHYRITYPARCGHEASD